MRCSLKLGSVLGAGIGDIIGETSISLTSSKIIANTELFFRGVPINDREIIRTE